MRPILLAVGFALLASTAVAQGAPTHAQHGAVAFTPDQVSWKPAPPTLPAGAKMAVLEGDLSAAGPFTMRAMFPDGYRIPPHFHPAVERVTVIQGTFRVGMGDTFEASALKSLPTGSFIAMPAEAHHFTQAKGNTVVQVNGIGPWKLTYVNPGDNPQKATP